jgi:DNA-binding SARP family transcriptional activator
MAGEARFRLYLLGPFRLEDRGQPLRLPTRKVELLLAYLALHPAPHTRERLAALLWADAPPDKANASLRTALNALRRHLGAGAVLSDRLTVQLDPALPLWVDAHTLAGLPSQAQADRLPAAPLADLSPDIPDDYAGELLADFYDDWLIPLRTVLATSLIRPPFLGQG